MVKRIIAGILLALVMLPLLSFSILSDTHIAMSDITQNTNGMAPDGYEYPFHFLITKRV